MAISIIDFAKYDGKWLEIKKSNICSSKIFRYR